MTRLFVPILNQNDNITLTNSLDINYLAKVMRKKIGDNLLVFNQQEGEFLTQIIEISNKKIILKLLERIRGYTKEKEVTLIFAPIKQNRISFLLEKATELGVTRLVPIITKHSVIDKINIDKWYIYIKEAAEQCGRLSVPEIKSLEKLSIFLENWDDNKAIIFCNERERDLSLMQCLKTKNTKDINILVGPEGGFSEEENGILLSKKNIVSVHLGEKILRAETACLFSLVLASQF